MKELLQMAFDTIKPHIPPDAAWIPTASIAVLGVLGLLLLVRGAKLAPAVAGLTFLGLGALGGSFLAPAVATPLWPTAGVVGLIGLGLGLIFFRFWLAVLVAGCFAGGALTLYTGKVLAPHLSNYTSSNLNVAAGDDVLLQIGLPEAGDVATAADSGWAELGHLWTYLTGVVPSFQASFWAIVLSTALAGLVFGLLLPKAARALLAATVGTVCFFTAGVALLDANWPSTLAELKSLGTWSWVIVAGVWALALLLNLRSLRKKPQKKDADSEADDAPSVARAGRTPNVL